MTDGDTGMRYEKRIKVVVKCQMTVNQTLANKSYECISGSLVQPKCRLREHRKRKRKE